MQSQCEPNAVKESKVKESKVKESKEKKELLLDFVYLTTQHQDQLKAKLGDTTFTYLLNQLNDYIGAKGAKYKSHYHTILMWHSRNNQGDKNGQCSVPEFKG